jgi:N6-adenosine-specific RNA methylase IME4
MLTIPQIKAAGGYGAIYVDPAWRYRDSSCRGAAEQHYTKDQNTGRSTMSDAELCALPVGEIAARDCALFLCGTWPKDREKYLLLDAWGFEYKTLAFIWHKYRSNSCRPFYGNGRWTRANSEPVWLATRGKPKRVDKGVDQLIETIEFDDDRLLQAPVMDHSKKPEEIALRIKKLVGDHIPAIELFARERVEGFDAWGNDPKIGRPDVLLTNADLNRWMFA